MKAKGGFFSESAMEFFQISKSKIWDEQNIKAQIF